MMQWSKLRFTINDNLGKSIFYTVNTLDAGDLDVPIWYQVISWTNADSMSIWPIGTNFTELLKHLD